MLLKKLNVLYEQVILQTKGDKSIDPSCQKAEPNKSLVNHEPYFKDKDDKRKADPGVPDEFAGKVADYKRRPGKLKRVKRAKKAE